MNPNRAPTCSEVRQEGRVQFPIAVNPRDSGHLPSGVDERPATIFRGSSIGCTESLQIGICTQEGLQPLHPASVRSGFQSSNEEQVRPAQSSFASLRITFSSSGGRASTRGRCCVLRRLRSFLLGRSQLRPHTQAMVTQPKPKPDVSLVFQGGGVRGLAHVGALTALCQHVTPVKFGGTSAGAIVAALLAAGADSAALNILMRKTNFRDAFVRKRSIIPLKGLLSQGWGVYDGGAIEEWVEAELRSLLNLSEPVCFKHLRFPLAVVTTDLQLREPRIYRSGLNDNDRVSPVVRRSASIPFFFDSTNDETDGGVLRNFPVELFAEEEEPTIGIRLDSGRATHGPTSLLEFAGAVMETVLTAHDSAAIARAGATVGVVTVPTHGISATDFDLTPAQQTALYNSGLNSVALWLVGDGGRFLADLATAISDSAIEAFQAALAGNGRLDAWAENDANAVAVENFAAEFAALSQTIRMGIGRRLTTARRLVFAQCLNNLGFVLTVRGQAARATSYLQTAVALAPSVSKMHRNLGEALGQWGAQLPRGGQPRIQLLAAAAREVERALDLPDRWLAGTHHSLGWILDEQDNLPGAEASYRKALEAIRAAQNPALHYLDLELRPFVAYNLACVLARQRRPLEALTELRGLTHSERAAASTDPDFESVRATHPQDLEAVLALLP